jgi:protein-S-isoprenylcysteine O-methyltransferase Ste14
MSSLIVKSFLGLIFLVFCLALALFLSAGSLRYWQAWLFLAVWTVCVAFITVYLLKYDQRLLTSRVQVGPTAETQKSHRENSYTSAVIEVSNEQKFLLTNLSGYEAYRQKVRHRLVPFIW